MTKEITKSIILQEMQDKFQLRDFESARFLFDETVIPTYDVGAHVKHWTVTRDRQVVSGNGALFFHVVPYDERWRVRKIDVYSETGGNFDIDQIFIATAGTEYQYLFFNTAAPIANGTVNMFNLPQDIAMQRSMLYTVYINVANFVAGGYVAIHMLREVETIR